MSELRMLSGGAAQALVGRIAPEFERDTGRRIAGTFSAVGAMKERLLAGVPCDVVVLTRALIDELAAGGHVVRGSGVDLGKVRTGVAVRSGDPLPAIADDAALRSALLEATSLYHPDPKLATAGIHFVRVLEGLGILDRVADRLRPHPNGATAMRELAAAGDRRPVGVTQVTEIRMTPGVVLVGVLPIRFELATVYTAAVCTRSEAPEDARRLVARLAQAAATEAGRAMGFDPE